MKSHNFLAGIILGAVAATGCAVIAQEAPVVDIGDRHGNLRDAQQHIVEAWRAVSRAQEANDARLGGHAGRAKELLAQANEELRLAADVANDRRRW